MSNYTDETREAYGSVRGVLGDLLAKRGKPGGYPVDKITLYALDTQLAQSIADIGFDDLNYSQIEVREAEALDGLLTLNYKVAGKLLGGEVKRLKDMKPQRTPSGWSVDGIELPEDAYIMRKEIPEGYDRAHKNRIAIELCEGEGDEEHWIAVQFAKEVKKHITETLKWDYLPEVFKAPRMHDEAGSTQDTLRVYVEIADCKERLYQALQKYPPFKGLPIFLKIPPRHKLRTDFNTTLFNAKLHITRKAI